MKKYVLLAGVNGAGKSTLFSLIPTLQEIEKINLDEMVRNAGDWRDTRLVMQVGKVAVGKINAFFEDGVSFSQETTLCGKTVLRNISRAKELGYRIELHYVGLNSAEIAKERVRHRVQCGGHGVDERDIERRYSESFLNLKKIIPLCDLVSLYDNSESLHRFAIYINGNCARLSSRVPDWFKSLR